MPSRTDILDFLGAAMVILLAILAFLSPLWLTYIFVRVIRLAWGN